MVSLINLYFEHVNLFSPLLHRPTFERSIIEGLHIEDSSFGSVVLLVCAVGSRFSNDPRVLLQGHDSSLSSGWKWFNQIHELQHRFLAPASLYDIQAYYVKSILAGYSAFNLSDSICISAAFCRILAWCICAASRLDYTRDCHTLCSSGSSSMFSDISLISISHSGCWCSSLENI